MILTAGEERRGLLERARTIAVVGASSNVSRPSYQVFSFLRAVERYRIAPINPTLREVDGVAAFPSLAAYAAANGAPDIVDVFRNPAEAPDVARDAIAVGARAIWFQLGVVNDAAIRLADEAGLDVVVDRCIKVDIAHFGLGASVDR
jgi:predicted CoA-binding protein